MGCENVTMLLLQLLDVFIDADNNGARILFLAQILPHRCVPMLRNRMLIIIFVCLFSQTSVLATIITSQFISCSMTCFGIKP